MKNKNLHKAKKEKNDEFYTQLSDIEKELSHYHHHFKGKIVYCNCDDHKWSNFFRYFSLNFEFLGLKKLIATHFDAEGISYKLEITADINGDGRVNHLDTVETPLKQNGDFRSPEAIELLKEADIVVTNPPFSLFREFVGQLMEYGKKFLVIGNSNAIVNSEVFKLIKDTKLWFGCTSPKVFEIPSNYPLIGSAFEDNGKKYAKLGNVCWFTNLSHNKRNEHLILYKIYNPEEYPKYDNYDAINVDKVKEIPMDYEGVMGVPISFLNKLNLNQFEILGVTNNSKEVTYGLLKEGVKTGYATWASINGKNTYARLLIKNKQL